MVRQPCPRRRRALDRRPGPHKVKFRWQANAFAPQRSNSDHSCWLRVMQRAAAAGGGHQFIPRIGQEVLVGFWATTSTVHWSTQPACTTAGVNRAWHPHKAGPSAHRTPQPGIARGAAPDATHSLSEVKPNAVALKRFKRKEFGGKGANRALLFGPMPSGPMLSAASNSRAPAD